ncbi:MAG TPA: D-2-hydroxyacid dehydrogenase family protein [Burkholderiales bacterium]|nr:D-2-hydroxyacid dehydrogenase family protein [Burkholderiales bacterium]
MKLAILDDYQRVALECADWERLRRRGVEPTVFDEAFATLDEAAGKLAAFEIVILMRERMPFPRALIERLPKLKLVVLTGVRSPSLDAAACSERGIPVSHTRSGNSGASTAELTWGLIIAAARDLARAERGMRAGRWHEGIASGTILEGRRLGLLGLGKLGARVARAGAAFGMEVAAWSENLTGERALAAGALHLPKDELLATSDVISVHLVLSERTRGLIGAAEFARMKRGAILVNTSRAPIVDEAAMLDALKSGRLGHAALDVYEREPLPTEHPLRKLDNVTLSPHLGYVSADTYRTFYQDVVESIEAWLDGKPVRLINPEASR